VISGFDTGNSTGDRGPSELEHSGVSSERLQIIIDLDLEAQPIAGLLQVEDGLPEPFSGWLALTQAIDQTLIARQGRDQAISEVHDVGT
jgi:hypothetical protein